LTRLHLRTRWPTLLDGGLAMRGDSQFCLLIPADKS